MFLVADIIWIPARFVIIKAGLVAIIEEGEAVVIIIRNVSISITGAP